MIPVAPDTLPWFLGVGLAAAAAIHPWGAILGLAATAGLAWVPPLPGALAGVGSPWVWIPTVVLAATEGVVQARPDARLAWEVIHSPVRLLLPPLLLLLTVDGVPGSPTLGPLALAGTLAAYLLVLRWGTLLHRELVGRLDDRSARWRLPSALAAGATLAPAAALAPVPTALATALGVAAVSLRLRDVLPLSPAVPRLIGDRLVLGTGTGAWRPRSRLPRWIRKKGLASARGNPLKLSRGMPALLCGEKPGQEARAGWLVVADGGPRFVFGSPSRIWEVELAGASASRLSSPGPLLRRMELRRQGERLVLGIPRGGPTAGELSRLLLSPTSPPPL